MEIEEDDDININEVATDMFTQGRQGQVEFEELAWSRKDYGTTRLMMPGPEGPLWSSCLNRVTFDMDTKMIVEDWPINEIRGQERRREFKGGQEHHDHLHLQGRLGH